MYFEFGRSEGFPSQYSEVHYPVTVDVLEAGFITAYAILLISFLVRQPKTNRGDLFCRNSKIFISLTIGLFIMLGNYGQEWEVDRIKTKTPYKAGTAQEINATIGVKIGLRSVNITLKSTTPPELLDEVINYNERFHWTWDQGRFGFGPYAGEIQQEFRAAQYKGLPTPILWIVDYFVIDGEGFRFGRFYRTAGWYSHILIWTSFATWLVANILFNSVIEYGAYFLCLTGLLQLSANLIWWVVRNPVPLVIPFEDNKIEPVFGFSYWLTFGTGIFCVVLAIVIIILDRFTNLPVHSYFSINALNIYEVAYVTEDEKQFLRNKSGKQSDRLVEDMEMVNPEFVRDNSKVTHPIFIRKTMIGAEIKNLINASRESVSYENLMFVADNTPIVPSIPNRYNLNRKK